jgi:Tol biopolymer transport system component
MLLYASNRDGNFDLYIKLLGSDILARLTNNIGEVSSSEFSPDGNLVVFSNSVDGKPSSLWLVNKDGSDPRKIYESTGNIAGAVWSPNGKSIAFAMSSAEALETYEVYIMDLETLTVGPVTKGHLPNAGGSVDWSPDGRSLLLFAGPQGDKNVFLFDIVSGHIRQLTNGGNNAAPVFSPDGRWVAFNSQRTGNADIFIMKPDGSDVRQLTNDPNPDWQPRWGR